MSPDEEKTTAEATEEVATEEPQAAAEEPKAEAAEEPKTEAAEEPKAEAAEEPQAAAPEPAKKSKKAKEEAPAEAAPAKAPRAKKSAAIEDILAAIKTMTVLELSELVKALEEEFGVSAAAQVMAAAPAAGAAAPAEAAETEEQTEFDVVLKDIGSNKINVIKAVRELTALGLKESKDLVESAPAPVKEKVSKEEATAAKEKLEAAGATAEVK